MKFWKLHRPPLLLLLLLFFLISLLGIQLVLADENALLQSDETSDRSRALASSQTQPTHPNQNDLVVQRSTFPESNPHICLAFLSCCNRELLHPTLAGAIRHMERDEPSYLKYEIAWVDNGSDAQHTERIRNAFQIEHALTLPSNMGLAYGMNLLIRDLCTAPYILLLEEDWLYMDDLVAPPTVERKRAIATSVALMNNLKRNNITAYDGRNILGLFLRHESYEGFLTFPHADIWERQEQVHMTQELESVGDPSSCTWNNDHDKNDEIMDTSTTTQQEQGIQEDIVDIDYRIFCADTGIKGQTIWGSYTNGAGLYHREDLMQIGRMFGEPGDAFHDRYVEANFAYRVALQYCHAALRLTNDTSCTAIHDRDCTGAFHHIGGGHGTRPRTPEGTKCEDPGWNFVGTPLYRKYRKYVKETTGQPMEICSDEELQELRDRRFRDLDGEAYREQVRKENEEVFRREAEERQSLREQAQLIIELLKTNPDALREAVPFMKDLSDEEIKEKAERMKRLVDSPHPLDGFWDMHGRVQTRE